MKRQSLPWVVMRSILKYGGKNLNAGTIHFLIVKLKVMKRIKNIFLLAAVPVFFSSCLKEDLNEAAGTVAPVATIDVVRSIYKGQDLSISTGTLYGSHSTYGVVVSDHTEKNIGSGTFVIQNTTPSSNQVGDITRGIVIDMGAGATIPVVTGDSVLINLVGATISRIKGNLTITGITGDKITKLKGNAVALVRPVTLGMLNAAFQEYESTLVSVHADVSGFTAGAVFSGEKMLDDHTGATVVLNTRADANFANELLVANAKFTGIAAYLNKESNDTSGAKKSISLRKIADTSSVSGVLYGGFPESFEVPDFTQKASYNMTATNNDVTLSTGSWKLLQGLLGNTLIRDKYNFPGKQCVRLQHNLSTSAYVQMNFDLLEGASKVTVFCGKYYTDPSSTFRLEYSVNSGTSWATVPGTGDVLDMPERGSKQVAFKVNVTGKVRFRINKLGLGTSTATKFNGRLCIEDFAVYKAP
jgi:hypothetical protein